MENCKQFFFLKKARHKLYFTASMLLTNSCGISFAFTNILNKERIGWLFKNKIDFYFGLGWHKTTNKKNPNHHKKSSTSSLCDTEEEMAASWLLSDLRVKYKLKNPMIQTSQHVSLSFVLSHPPQVSLRTGSAKVLSTGLAAIHTEVLVPLPKISSCYPSLAVSSTVNESIHIVCQLRSLRRVWKLYHRQQERHNNYFPHRKSCDSSYSPASSFLKGN